MTTSTREALLAAGAVALVTVLATVVACLAPDPIMVPSRENANEVVRATGAGSQRLRTAPRDDEGDPGDDGGDGGDDDDDPGSEYGAAAH